MKKYLILFSILFATQLCLGAAKSGGTLRLASISDPKTFNLIIAQETSTTEAVGLLFEGLTKINGETTEAEPCLAESWSHSEDGLEWTFVLRKGVLWFDGKELSADDVLFTYNSLIYNKDIPSSSRDIFTVDGKIFKVEKIDNYTVKFTTPTPYAPLLYNLSQPILPKHILEKSVQDSKFNEMWGINTKPSDLIGTGPFKLVEYLPGQRLVYEKNSNYWKKDSEGNTLPYIDKIVTYIVQNIDAQILKFKAGEIDIVSLQGKDYAIVKGEEKKKNCTVYDCGPSFGTDFLSFNMSPIFTDKQKLVWFGDINFRQAIAFAIDRESMINNVLYGMGSVQHASMSESAKAFYNPNVKHYECDTKRSKDILKNAGFVDSDNDGILEKPAGVPVKFTILTNAENNMRVDLGTIIQSDLKAIGIDASLRPIDFNNLVTKLNYTHDWDCVLLGFTGGIEPHSGKNVWAIDGQLHIWNQKPEAQRTQSMTEEPTTNYQQQTADWEKEIDRLFNTGVQELDPQKRKQIYDKWQEITAENLPLIYTVNAKVIYAINNKIKNIRPSAYGGALHNVEGIWIEEIK